MCATRKRQLDLGTHASINAVAGGPRRATQITHQEPYVVGSCPRAEAVTCQSLKSDIVVCLRRFGRGKLGRSPYRMPLPFDLSFLITWQPLLFANYVN